MNAEVFAKGLEKCRLLTRLLAEIVENLDDYGCPKVQDLVKTDSSLMCSGFFSDKKQSFTVPWGKQRCMEIGLCNICKFLYMFVVFVLTTILNLSTRHDFVYSIRFEKLSLRNRWLIKKVILIWEELFLTTIIKKENLGPVWDKPVPDRWLCFCPNFFVILLIIFGCFWRIHLSKTCDESTVWVRIFCSAARYILPGPRLWTSYFLQKIELLLLSTFPTSLRCYAKGKRKPRVFAWSELWINWFVKKQWYKVLYIFWQLLWKNLQFTGLCWQCHLWETSGSEHNLH